jgi:hypothetical protein
VLPDRLSDTGLFDDLSEERLALHVHPYTPAFALWSDGADKRRWVYLPEGTRIDDRNPDDWRFPVGTKLWKEFSQDGVRLETRLLTRTGAGEADWVATAYLWRADQSEALRAPYGAIDALGTAHDVPASGECFACHDGRPGRVLGFSAIQLAVVGDDAVPGLAPDAAADLLSDPLPAPLEVPGTRTEREALGYLHANCSHCHNQSGAGKAAGKCLDPNDRLGFALDFSLQTDALESTARTATYRTAFGKVIVRGAPDDSKLVELMSRRGSDQMPPLATDEVDEHGLQLMRAWIGGL